MRIYIFTTLDKEGEITISQVYATSFIIGFHLMECLNPGYSWIDFVGFEDTCKPEEWDYLTNQIRLSN